ncbi:uncharacterized protein CMU_030720 [Cryptosporidium muris RN66]|uniref:Uncharacterized protein n=1 Tax=Cryptosporidium muris (strain RN66) TaxID=441375 RepID=B6AK33_CRYMR|nr:uncharacterized protein CMU_030720 [Cryptosporidium muris RN66]EEA08574.1 hypothetical protein, conserved [Cryptosporidium muris RN66]|eukprot:XP_002142923.1 hypothetical protein [Cryptosporidium muris RN66]
MKLEPEYSNLTTEVELNTCSDAIMLVNNIQETQESFPIYNLYVNDIIKDCSALLLSKYEKSGLCKNKSNKLFATCCNGKYESLMADSIKNIECIIAAVASGNLTNNILIGRDNQLNNRIEIILEKILKNKTDNFPSFIMGNLKKSYELESKLLQKLEKLSSDMINMFLKNGVLVMAQEAFVKYLTSLFCGICDISISQLILSTGNLKVIQIHPNSMNNLMKILLPQYNLYFEKLGKFGNKIETILGDNIEKCIDYHNEWILSVLSDRFKRSNYDINNMINIGDKVIMENLSSKQNTWIKKHSKIARFSNMLKNNLNFQISNNNKYSKLMIDDIQNIIQKIKSDKDWRRYTTKCIRSFPIYKITNDKIDITKLDLKRLETLLMSAISDPSGHTFISNLVLIPILCLKTIIIEILTILPDPMIDLNFYYQVKNDNLTDITDLSNRIVKYLRIESYNNDKKKLEFGINSNISLDIKSVNDEIPNEILSRNIKRNNSNNSNIFYMGNSMGKTSIDQFGKIKKNFDHEIHNTLFAGIQNQTDLSDNYIYSNNNSKLEHINLKGNNSDNNTKVNYSDSINYTFMVSGNPNSHDISMIAADTPYTMDLLQVKESSSISNLKITFNYKILLLSLVLFIFYIY